MTRKQQLQEVANNLIVAAYTLRAERRKFSSHTLRSQSMLHVYRTLSEIAGTLEMMTDTLYDINFLEGNEMGEKQYETTEEAVKTAQENGTQDAAAAETTNSDGSTEKGPSSSDAEAANQTDRDQGTPAEISEKAPVEFSNSVTVVSQSLAEIIAQISSHDTKTTSRLDIIERKFTGIGRAIEVLTKSIQKPATESGGNGELGNKEQGG